MAKLWFVMATLRYRQHKTRGLWEVQIRRKDCPYLCLSFATKEEAVRWIVENEKRYIEDPMRYLGWERDTRYERRVDREFGVAEDRQLQMWSEDDKM